MALLNQTKIPHVAEISLLKKKLEQEETGFEPCPGRFNRA